MPVYARDKNGHTLKFDSVHEAKLFGTEPITDEEATGVTRPTMTNLLDPSGMLKDQYRIKAGADIAFNPTAINTQAIEELRKRGMAVGPTEQAKYLTKAQQLEEENARGRAANQVAGASSYAFGQGASHGGLSTGARERLAMNAANQLTNAGQDIGRQGMTARLGILSEDEKQKLGILGALPGQELGLSSFGAAQEKQKADLGLANRAYQTDVNKMNILGALGETARQDASKMAEYREKMGMYGAEKTAQAQANAGKK